MNGPPAISVVVPAYRAERTIAACIGALRQQRHAPPFEVVLVDSSPDEGTAVAARAANPPGPSEIELHIARSDTRLYPGSARNRGVGQARAPWILFLDTDCLAGPDLLARAAQVVAGGPRVVGGSIALAGPRTASARIRHLLEFKESLPTVPGRATWMLPSACLLVERSTFAQAGGFPDTRASEDWMFDWGLWQRGCSMAFDPRLAVGHLTPSGWRGLARYSRVLGRESGVARARGGLPGQILVRWPLLAFGLPVARTVRALVWTARHAPAEFAFLLLAWPAYLAMAAVWARGFLSGVRAETGRALAAPAGRT